jgi:cbb3-type cytochrome oxidase maturation protein
MSAIFLLIGFSLVVALIFLSAFLWAMRNHQYTDTQTPALRILFDADSTQVDTHPKDFSTEVSQ